MNVNFEEIENMRCIKSSQAVVQMAHARIRLRWLFPPKDANRPNSKRTKNV